MWAFLLSVLYYIFLDLECCFFILPLIISNSEGTVECSCRLRTFSKALVEYPLWRQLNGLFFLRVIMVSVLFFVLNLPLKDWRVTGDACITFNTAVTQLNGIREITINHRTDIGQCPSYIKKIVAWYGNLKLNWINYWDPSYWMNLQYQVSCHADSTTGPWGLKNRDTRNAIRGAQTQL